MKKFHEMYMISYAWRKSKTPPPCFPNPIVFCNISACYSIYNFSEL